MKKLYFLIIFFCISSLSIKAQTIWSGADIEFSKENDADWTLEENQDRLTDNVWITRQDRRQIYNYKWWQDNFNRDAEGDELRGEFWSDGDNATGGTKGVRWALLDDTGANSDWSGYNFGVLGDSTYFYSFNNIIQIIEILEDEIGDFSTIEVINDFSVGFDLSTYASPDIGDYIVGKKFGVWLQEDDVYLTMTFNSWQAGALGGGFSYTRSSDQTSSVDNNPANSFKLSPNPSAEFIQISGIEREMSYVIYDILGKEIENGLVMNDQKINVGNLSNGMYLLKLEEGNTIKFQKI